MKAHIQNQKLTIKNININDPDALDKIHEQAYDKKVIEIDLSGNQIGELPFVLIDFILLKTVRKLNLSNNLLTTLPGYIRENKNLKEIKLEGNPLISPPPEIIKKGTQSILDYLKKPMSQKELASILDKAAAAKVKLLDLSERKIEKIPKNICNLTELEVLKLNNNKIRSLPVGIVELNNLRKLELLGNRLTSFPIEIIHLPNLEVLTLESNSIKTLPPAIQLMTSLKELSLTANDLVLLPSEIGQLTNMVKLEILFNRLTSLPPEIGNLKGLRALFLDHNEITYLPSEIGHLKKLKILGLFGNKLSSLPPEFSQLKSLTELDIRDNCIERFASGKLLQKTKREPLFYTHKLQFVVKR